MNNKYTAVAAYYEAMALEFGMNIVPTEPRPRVKRRKKVHRTKNHCAHYRKLKYKEQHKNTRKEEYDYLFDRSPLTRHQVRMEIRAEIEAYYAEDQDAVSVYTPISENDIIVYTAEPRKRVHTQKEKVQTTSFPLSWKKKKNGLNIGNASDIFQMRPKLKKRVLNESLKNVTQRIVALVPLLTSTSRNVTIKARAELMMLADSFCDCDDPLMCIRKFTPYARSKKATEAFSQLVFALQKYQRMLVA